MADAYRAGRTSANVSAMVAPREPIGAGAPVVVSTPV